MQNPTKLGLKANQTLKVEDAIKGLVTKSANDAAVVVAETIGGALVPLAMAMALVSRGWVYGRDLLHVAFPLAEHDERSSVVLASPSAGLLEATRQTIRCTIPAPARPGIAPGYSKKVMSEPALPRSSA